jgi:O-antigen ligase
LFLALTPWGKSFSRYLPFVGQVETGSIDYRSRLLDVSLEVLTEKPWFGDIFYLNNPKMETMRQGQGIIDMVNTYLQVALPFGLVGLGLFLAVFVFGLLGANAKRKQFDPGTEIVGRSVIAATIGALVTIFTVSSISVIPTLYWILAGVLVAYARMAVPSTGNATDATSAANKKLRRRRA